MCIDAKNLQKKYKKIANGIEQILEKENKNYLEKKNDTNLLNAYITSDKTKNKINQLLKNMKKKNIQNFTFGWRIGWSNTWFICR